MGNYQHKSLLKKIADLSQEPLDPVSFERWITAKDQIDFLDSNSEDDELILYAAEEKLFVHGVAVKRDLLFPLDKDDLLGWSGNPYGSRAGYGFDFDDSGVWIDEGCFMHGSKAIEKAQQLVFMRDFEGLNDHSTYCEILQEFLHLSEIHWRNELKSYCRFDENGDFDSVVSVTIKDDVDKVTLVSVQREPLELYLAASDSVLVQMFDFTCYQSGKFSSWPDEPEKLMLESDELFFRQKIDSKKAGYTRGIQVVPLSRSKLDIFSSYQDRWYGKEKAYVEFEAYDWRNRQHAKISTDPDATSNYFDGDENTLPFETSWVFFRSEVLSKYKSDGDKYTYDEVNRTISCRNQWLLKSVDVNEAGQVHTYICDLRTLPHQEQLYWLSCNEPMKDTISKRSLEADFAGRWYSDTDSLQDIRPILERWDRNDVSWWKLRRRSLLYQTSPPRTESRDEWGQSFLDLSHLIIEGFMPKVIKGELDRAKTPYQAERSIALLEKLLM
jgi:hypothetical protein